MTNTNDENNDDFIAALRDALWVWRKSVRDGSRPIPTALLELFSTRKYLFQGYTEREAVVLMLSASLATMKETAPQYAEILQRRFEQGHTMADLLRAYNWSERSMYNHQTEAVKFLAQAVIEREKGLLRQQAVRLANLPPPTYSKLVGGASKIETLLPLFTAAHPASLIAFSGMGGIGKTSLATELTRQVMTLAVFEKMAWVSAQRVALSLGGQMVTVSDAPALTLELLVQTLARQLFGETPNMRVPHHDLQEMVARQLLDTPHLVIVDNLETVPDVQHLLPFLRRVGQISKVLLTSRVQLLDEGDVFLYQVPLLTFEESVTLLHQEAEVRNIPSLLQASKDLISQIYEVVGGNPLALRLVAGQIHWHGLEVVLGDLKASGGTGEQLYRYLFEWTWNNMAEPTRAVLLAMPLLAPTGGTQSDLVTFTDLPVTAVRTALKELIDQNLVNVAGSAEQRLYTTHNLTRGFLQEHVAQWL